MAPRLHQRRQRVAGRRPGDRRPPGAVDRAVLLAGAARTTLAGGAPLTPTSELAVEILGRPPAVVLHFEGWAHFSEGADSLRAAFARRGLADRLRLPEFGESIRL